MQQEDPDSLRDSADCDLSLSDHITIPGLDTFEVLNTDHDSFLMALEASNRGRPFDPVELDKHAFRESLLLRTEREVGTIALQKQVERAKEHGIWLQKRIFNAKRNEIITLPAEVFRFTSLHID